MNERTAPARWEKWFTVTRQEQKAFWLLCGAMSLATFANYVLWNSLQTAVIKRMGTEALTYMYAGSSLCILFGAVLLNSLQRRLQLYRATLALTALSVAGMALSALAVDHEALLWPFLIVALLTNSAVLTSLFTAYGSVMHDALTTDQNERWIRWVGVVGTLAGIASGFFLSTLGESWPLSWIIAAGTAAIALAGALTRPWRRLWPVISVSASLNPAAATVTTGEAYGAMRRTKFLWTIGLTVFLSMIFTRIFAYAFTVTADYTFPNEGDMISFLGRYDMLFNAVSLPFSAFVSMALFRRFGLTGGMFLPLAVVGLGTTGVFAWPGMIAVATNNFFRDLIVGFQGAILTLLLVAVPTRLHRAINGILDGHLTMAGGMAGAGLLWLFQRYAGNWPLRAQLRAIAAFALGLLVIRVWISWQTRKDYVRTISRDAAAGDLPSRLRALEAFVEARHVPGASLETVLSVIHEESEPLPLRVKAADVLGALKRPSTLRLLRHLVDHPEYELRIAVIRALAQFEYAGLSFTEAGLSRQEIIEALRKRLEEASDAEEEKAVIVALGTMEDPDLARNIAARLKDARPEYQAAIVGALAEFTDPAVIDFARPLLASPHGPTARAAAKAVWRYAWERPSVIGFLKEHESSWPLADRLHMRFALGEMQEADVRHGMKDADPEARRQALRGAWVLGLAEAEEWTRAAFDAGDRESYALLIKPSTREKIIPGAWQRLDALLSSYAARVPSVMDAGGSEPSLATSLAKECVAALAELADRYEETDSAARLRAMAPVARGILSGRVWLVGLPPSVADAVAWHFLSEGYGVDRMDAAGIAKALAAGVAGPALTVAYETETAAPLPQPVLVITSKPSAAPGTLPADNVTPQTLGRAVKSLKKPILPAA